MDWVILIGTLLSVLVTVAAMTALLIKLYRKLRFARRRHMYRTLKSLTPGVQLATYEARLGSSVINSRLGKHMEHVFVS